MKNRIVGKGIKASPGRKPTTRWTKVDTCRSRFGGTITYKQDSKGTGWMFLTGKIAEEVISAAKKIGITPQRFLNVALKERFERLGYRGRKAVTT